MTISPLVRCARLSREAYRDMSLPESAVARVAELASMGLVSRDSFDAFGLIAFTAEDAGTLYLVFRGTANLQDFFIDAEIAVEPIRLMRCDAPHLMHAGFVRAWRSLRDWCLSLDLVGRQLVVTGHSLGGALATMAACDLPALPALYTYGSPRVGVSSFAVDFNAITGLQSVRCVHDVDIVPTVPGLPYQHVQGLLLLSRDGLHSPGLNAPAAGLLGRAHQVLADLDGEAESDHHIDSYVAACTAYNEFLSPVSKGA